MTRDERRAYSKGYLAGSRHSWPAHRPPVPPEPVLGRLIIAVQKLRDAADNICATLCEEDEFVAELGPPVDEVDTAMAAITESFLDSLYEREG